MPTSLMLYHLSYLRLCLGEHRADCERLYGIGWVAARYRNAHWPDIYCSIGNGARDFAEDLLRDFHESRFDA